MSIPPSKCAITNGMNTNKNNIIENFISIFSKSFFLFYFRNILIINTTSNEGIKTLFSNFSDKNRDIPTNKLKIYPIIFIVTLNLFFIFNYFHPFYIF